MYVAFRLEQLEGARTAKQLRKCPVCDELVSMEIPASIILKETKFPLLVKVKHREHHFYVDVDSWGTITDVLPQRIIEGGKSSRGARCPVCSTWAIMSIPSMERQLDKEAFPYIYRVWHISREHKASLSAKPPHKFPHIFYIEVDSDHAVTKVFTQRTWSHKLNCPVCSKLVLLRIEEKLLLNARRFPLDIAVNHEQHRFYIQMDTHGTVRIVHREPQIPETTTVERTAEPRPPGQWTPSQPEVPDDKMALPAEAFTVAEMKALAEGLKLIPQIYAELHDLHDLAGQVRTDTKVLREDTRTLTDGMTRLLHAADENQQTIDKMERTLQELAQRTDDTSKATREVLSVALAGFASFNAGQSTLEQVIAEVAEQVKTVGVRLGIGRSKMDSLKDLVKKAAVEGAKTGAGAGIWYLAKAGLALSGIILPF